MENVLILMSTYNGEKYIREQLESIFAQKNINVHLLVRDDGSSDATVSIIHEFGIKHPKSIEVIQGDNIGWKQSFFSLAKKAVINYPTYKYFAFADQDDIWLPEKLSKSIYKIQSLPKGANLYCSNLIYFKEGIKSQIIRNKPICASFKNCLIRNYATGCTVVFNRNLLERVCIELPRIDIAHDYWFYMVATLCGSVIIDNESYIYYRQHQNSQIGYKRGFIEIWHRRLKSVRTLIANHDKELIAKELIRIHGHSMNESARNAVKKLSNYRESILNRLELLFDSGYSFNKKSSDFWLKMRIIFGNL